MLLTKEYPATHSMSTSWFFVDKDDNIAIFDIHDNGPVPVEALDTDEGIETLCFDSPVVSNSDGLKVLNLTDEQVELMLSGLWTTRTDDHPYWFDEIFHIDVNREKEFLDYLSVQQKKVKDDWDDRFQPVCLSRKLGYYMVSLDEDDDRVKENPHVRFLFESGIVLRYCGRPEYDNFGEQWENFTEFYAQGSCPYYLYDNDYLAEEPHKRVGVPQYPVKLSQMPAHLRDKITRLNLRFSDSEAIQIAAEIPCYQSIYHDDFRSDNGYYYAEAIMPSGERVLVLNMENKNLPEGIPLIRPLLKPKYDD